MTTDDRDDRDDRDDQDDQALLHAWRAGDRRAGKRLYERYIGILYRFFNSKSPDATKELIQATLVALLDNHDNFRGDGTFRSYVLGIARNTFLHYLRKQGRDRLVLDGEELSCEQLGLGPFDVVAKNEELRLLVKALRRIPVDSQILIELWYWEGLTSGEIGQVLGTSASTIRDRKKRALEQLRGQLTRMMNDEDRVESTLMGLTTWAGIVKKILGSGGSSGGSPASGPAG